MKCPRCEKDISENESVCRDCGPATGPSAAAIEYACFSVRALALVCDVFVVCAVTLPFVVMVTLINSSGSWPTILFAPVFVLYMTVAQFVFHTTVGKRLFGLQIRTAAKVRPYPDLLELVFRESAGRYLSGLWIGQGFLAATYDPLHMTWADRLVGTVVVKALPVSRTLKIARVLLLVMGAILMMGIMMLTVVDS